MVKVKDVLKFINRDIPFATQMEWDNSGLLIGDENKEVNLVAVMLDATQENIQKAINNHIDLIICHHPVIFGGVKTVMSDSAIYSLIKNDISLISVHTPWDICEDGVNYVLASTLGLKHIKPFHTQEGGNIVKYGSLNGGMSANNFINMVRERVDIPFVKYVCCGEFIRTVAVCGGSGSDFIEELAGEVDAYVTSDVTYHKFLRAKELGLTLIDAGHYNTEALSMNPLAVKIAVEFPNIKVMRLKSKDPISYN